MFCLKANNLLAHGDSSLKQIKEKISTLRKGSTENLCSSLKTIAEIIGNNPGTKTVYFYISDYFFSNLMNFQYNLQ